MFFIDSYISRWDGINSISLQTNSVVKVYVTYESDNAFLSRVAISPYLTVVNSRISSWYLGLRW